MRSAERAEPDRALGPLRHRRRALPLTASAASVAAAAVAAFVLQLPAGTGPGASAPGHARAASCRWCVAHRAFLQPAFVEVEASLAPPAVLLNPVASA